MNVLIRMTRAENIARFGSGTVTIDMEEYLCGVVPAEMYDSANAEALKARAIAARTFVLRRAMAGTVIDDTSNHQAYRYSLAQSSPNSRKAIEETRGMVLCYDGNVINCFYSASNGGVTKRSGDVWRQHYPYYVNKIDEWDVNANRERPTKVSHGVGLSQIGVMWAAKQGLNHKAILAFYYEGTAIAADYGRRGSSVSEQPNDEKGDQSLVLHERIMTKNDSYQYGRKINPTGIMVHSTAAPGVMAAAWFDRWNRSYKAGETTRQVSVHAFLDDQEVWQYLPWDQRAWHAAGKANDTHIAFEICEPKGHRYEGGAKMVNYDVQKNEAYFRAIWRNAVELCCMLCKQYNIPVANIIGHYEGKKMGIANNHADPGHWFPKHGESMDSFRAAVQANLGNSIIGTPVPQPEPAPNPEPAPSPTPETPATSDYILYNVKDGDTLWAIARDRLGTGTRYREIMTLNGLLTDKLRLGQMLKLPE